MQYPHQYPFESMLAEWKVLHDKVGEAQRRMREAEDAQDMEKVQFYRAEVKRLRAASDDALKALHAALKAHKGPSSR